MNDFLRKKKIRFLWYFFFLLIPVGAEARDACSLLSNALIRLGMENVSCVENDSVYVLSLENTVYRLEGKGLRAVIEQLPLVDKPVRIILLKNNVPRLLLSSPAVSENNAPEKWNVTYRLEKADKEVFRLPQQNSSLFRFDLVFYPEIKYRNIRLDRIYDWLVNISPAIEFSVWKGMKFTAQVIFPLVNQYGERYKQIRPGFVTLSQQARFPCEWFTKISAGLFDHDRWGMDLKLFHPFKNEHFALNGQIGLTGTSSFYNWEWYYSLPKRVTGSLGAQYYYSRYNIQCNITAARYIAGDYGGRIDLMRHFRYTTIGFYGLKTNKSNWNGGFFFTVALPPYKQKRKRFRITTAPYFDIEYNADADFYYGRSYRSSPAENPSCYTLNPYFIASELK